MQTIKLAFRNLFRNTRRTILTVMLISLSLTALIAVDAVVRGMLTLFVENVTSTLNGEAQIHRVGYRENLDVDLFLDNSMEIEQALSQDAALQSYSPRVISGGMISSSYNVSAGLLYGIDADREQTISKVAQAIVRGEYLTGEDSELLIGQSMAELLEVDLGDRIVLTLSETNTGELAQALFRISGILEFGMRELDDNFVFINIVSARKALAMSDQQTHEFVLTFVNPEDAENPDSEIFQQLNDEEIEALGWMDLNRDIGLIIELMGYSSLIVGAVLFLLASLGVINSMFMSIYERIYEFGVIKAIGTRPEEVTRLILCEAFLLATISCGIGLLLGFAVNSWTFANGIGFGEMEFQGIAISNNIFGEFHISQFTQFPIYVVILTIAAAIYPARFAARIIPSEALQRSL
ncbi:MAG: ABC transporter permease [Gammaproteobacteria bacterium]|nr:ABC transporter permease [Gammaproteobacteria bacterium]